MAALDSVLELQADLVVKGSAYWPAVLEYCSQHNLVTSGDWGLLSKATKFPGVPLDSDRDYLRLKKLLDRAVKHGFRDS